MELKSFADASLAREILSKLYSAAIEVDLIEHGYDNLVGLVDRAYAVRFPRNQNAYLRSQYERIVLKELEDLTSVVIPKVLGENHDPPYVITTFVKGTHLSSAEIRNLSEKDQISLGNTIGQFAYEMHTKLSVREAFRLRNEFGLDGLEEKPWTTYLKERLFEYTFPTERQTDLAKKHYTLWQELHTEVHPVVVHNDLHNENMLFERNTLVGVLDFGDTNIGSPEQEFRQLYRINDQVLGAAIDVYQNLSGRKLSSEASRAWALAQELAAYSERLAKNDTNHPSFLRAAKNLNAWLPESEWQELEPSIGSKQ
ncbi:phosphotransferase [Patescibacteria group bacterium]|jgi:aminoglycoside phosphotransferase (APT) family kinase protein|nr:phosphotransferase [Patescibacteria group bacterium]